MTARDKNARRGVSEPTQVYLVPSDRLRLQRLSDALRLTKSDVLRRALEALERELLDPAQHPALRIIGMASGETGRAPGYNVAREHDRFLADTESASWRRGKRGR